MQTRSYGPVWWPSGKTGKLKGDDKELYYYSVLVLTTSTSTYWYLNSVLVLTGTKNQCTKRSSSQTWTLYRKHTKQLERFHMRYLRSTMGIKWQDRVTSLKVLDRASLVSIETVALKAQLRWTGHVIRMEPFRLPLQLLCGELRQRQRPRGRPKKRFKDCTKNSPKHSGTPSTELQNLAQADQLGAHWRDRPRKSSRPTRRDHLASARQRRKASTPALSTTATFHCP